jgi:hypothetical protein
MNSASAFNIEASLSNCAKISKNEDRLACFDLLSNKFKILPIDKKTAPKVMANTKNKKHVQEKVIIARNKETTIEAFGASHLKNKHTESKETQSIVLTISKIKKNAHKELIISFENGQVWQQKDSSYFKIEAGNKVQLTKGALGSIYLKKTGDSKRRIRVKRIK